MKRYNVAPWNDGKDAVCEADDGKYVLFSEAQYFAMNKSLVRARKEIREREAELKQNIEWIKKLEAEVKKLTAERDKYKVFWDAARETDKMNFELAFLKRDGSDQEQPSR